MHAVRILNKTRESVLGTRILVADRWWPRLRGLLGRGRPAGGDGLLLVPCRAVHTVGMRYPIDIVFLDRHGAVVALYPELRPLRVTRFHRSAEYALELPAGTIAASGTTMSDRLVWKARDEDVSAITTEEAAAGATKGSQS